MQEIKWTYIKLLFNWLDKNNKKSVYFLGMNKLIREN